LNCSEPEPDNLKGSVFASFWIHARPTLVLALPIIAGQLSHMLMGILDAAMVGHVGVVPLAASSFANNLLAIPLVFGIGLLSALSVRISQAHGAGDNHVIANWLRHGLIVALVSGILLMLGTAALSFGLSIFRQPADVTIVARPFFLLMGFSMPAVMLSFALKNYCEALGHAWLPMLILLAGVPVNAILNWVFIYGNLGSPALGLTGAGLGTLLARFISLVAMALFVWRSPHFRNQLPAKWRVPIDWNQVRPLLQIGIPAAFQTVIEVGAFSAGALLVGQLGTTALAAHQIALSCASTTFMLPLGIGVATSIRVAQAVGAGSASDARAIGLNSCLLGLACMSVAAAGYLVFGQKLAQIFVKDAAVIQLASRILIVVAVFQIADGLQIVSASALRGLADATVPLVVCIVAYWVIGLPVGALAALRFGQGAVGVWMGLAVGLTVAAVALVARFWQKSGQTTPVKSPSTAATMV
jgi:multidrug resistance protein, MATE family